MSAHSQVPWSVHPLFQTDIMDAERVVAQTLTSNPRRFEDARFIVTAVNHHAELVELVKRAMDGSMSTIKADAILRRIEGGT